MKTIIKPPLFNNMRDKIRIISSPWRNQTDSFSKVGIAGFLLGLALSHLQVQAGVYPPSPADIPHSISSGDNTAATPAMQFANSGFEKGNFSDWAFGDNTDNSITALTPWLVCTADDYCGWFGNNTPQEGYFDALNGFDGSAGYQAYLYQDIKVPANGGKLSFYDRIQYNSLGIPSFFPRVYEVQIRDVTDKVLNVLHHQEIMLNNQPYTDLGWMQRSFNLSQYAGQVIRVYIWLSVPENYTGPAQIEFDNFNLQPGGLLAKDVELTATKNGTQVNLTLTTSSEAGTAEFKILRGIKLDNGGTKINVVCTHHAGKSPYTCTDKVLGNTYRVLEIEDNGDIISYDEVNPR